MGTGSEQATSTRAVHGVVDFAAYVDGRRVPGPATPAEALERARRDGGFAWVGLFEPTAEQLNGIARVFGLHELAVEDAVVAYQRPKLETYPDTVFLVLKTVHYVPHSSPTTAVEIFETGEIMAFLGPDFLVTVRHRDHSGLGDLRAELEAQPQRMAAGPAAVLHALADHIVDDYLVAMDSFEDDVDQVEAMVFSPNSTIGPEQMYVMKREVVELRRSILPLVGPMRALADGENPLVPPEVRSYFRDVADHLTTVAERVTGFDDILSSLLEAATAKVTLQQNNDMRKITSWAAIIAVPTLIVGVYGMNFDHMPELRWKFGYPLVMAVIAVICRVLYVRLKRNRWL